MTNVPQGTLFVSGKGKNQKSNPVLIPKLGILSALLICYSFLRALKKWRERKLYLVFQKLVTSLLSKLITFGAKYFVIGGEQLSNSNKQATKGCLSPFTYRLNSLGLNSRTSTPLCKLCERGSLQWHPQVIR